jgi:hypothetical protein
MGLCDINAIKEVSVEFVVEFGAERLAQMLGTRPQDLIRSHRRSLWFLLHDRLSFWWRGRKVRMPVQVPFLEPDRLDLYGLDLLEILLVV